MGEKHEITRPDGTHEVHETSTGHSLIRQAAGPLAAAAAIGIISFVWGGGFGVAGPGGSRTPSTGKHHAVPDAPTVVAVPYNTSVGMTASGYSGDGSDPHYSTEWTITKESTGDTVFLLNTLDSLTSWYTAGDTVPLVTDSVYVLHARFAGKDGGMSAEGVDTFTAAAAAPDAPSLIVIPADTFATLLTGDFLSYNTQDGHASTNWVILKESNGDTAFQSLADADSLLEYYGAGPLETDTTYVVHVSFVGAFALTSTEAVDTFVATSGAPATPTLSVVPFDTAANLSTSSFSSPIGDQHATSDWWITKVNDATDTVWSDFTSDSLLSWKNAGATAPLQADTSYIAHVRHTGSTSGSSGEAVDTFTAQYATPSTPALSTSPGDTAVDLSGSTFQATPGDTHASSDWWITSLAGDTVWSSFTDVDSLTSWAGAGASIPLTTGDTLIAHLIYNATHGGASAEAVDTFTTGAAVPLFSDGFESGDFTYSANGVSWSQSTSGGGADITVSTEQAHTGTHSMRMPYGPQADCDDDKTEKDYFLPNIGPEIWYEYWIYVPSNFVHRSQAGLGCTSGSRNNKFGSIWSTTYAGNPLNEIEFTYEFQSFAGTYDDGTASYFRMSVIHGDSAYSYGSPTDAYRPNTSFPDTLITAADPGWHRIRFHFKLSDTDQGYIQLWVDDTLLYSLGPVRGLWDSISGKNYFHQGYVMGWSNSGYDAETVFYIDDYKVWDSDPGWN